MTEPYIRMHEGTISAQLFRLLSYFLLSFFFFANILSHQTGGTGSSHSRRVPPQISIHFFFHPVSRYVDISALCLFTLKVTQPKRELENSKAVSSEHSMTCDPENRMIIPADVTKSICLANHRTNSSLSIHINRIQV